MTAMLAEGAVESIPWMFTDAEGGVWIWRTNDFEAVLGHGFFWRLEHHGGVFDQRRTLGEGRARTFGEAESAVREMVGKCYPAAAGYLRFAGALATTFTLATGQRVDFGPYARKPVIVEVRNSTGGKDAYQGSLRVRNHMLDLDRPGTTTISILPGHIVGIRCLDGSVPQAGPSGSANRMHEGRVVRGCTGHPGYRMGYVDHMGADRCPVHE